MFRKLLIPAALALVITLAALTLGGPSSAPAEAAGPLTAEEQTFAGLINNYRAQNGLGALTIDPLLQDTAEWMSADMANNNYFSHTDSLGRDPFVRMAAFGYTYNTWKGENLAAGTPSAQVAFQLWKDSPGHNANMLNPNFKVMGVKLAFNAASSFQYYWANEFGGQASAAQITATPKPATPVPTPIPATPTPTPTPVKVKPPLVVTPTPNGQATGTPAPVPTGAPSTVERAGSKPTTTQSAANGFFVPLGR